VIRNDKNLNLPGTMTRLFTEARGKYVGMQHDHDLYHPEFLSKMVKLMETHPTAGFGCCAYRMIDGDDHYLADRDSSEFYLFPKNGLLPGKDLMRILATKVHTPIPAMGTIFRKEIVDRVGGYRPDWYLAADEDLYLRVAAISDVAFCRERLFTMRVRPDERRHVLGGWKGLYTLYEFRRETTDRYFGKHTVFRVVNKWRLTLLQYRALVIESLYLWLRGDRVHLSKGLDFKTLRHDRKVLNPISRGLGRLWIGALSVTARFGEALGERIRAKKQL
jgi:GT2 family glycosyltransferase